jgi:glycosidase
MQWTDARNGGFSRARPSRLRRPLVEGGFGPQHVNVAQQRTDPESLHAFMCLLIKRYRESPELGWGELTILDQPHAHVLAHQCELDDRRIVAVHNLASEGCTVPLTIPGSGAAGDRLLDLLADTAPVDLDEKGRAEVTLEGYGYRWLRVATIDNRRLR